jgi:hypothetical protein
MKKVLGKPGTHVEIGKFLHAFPAVANQGKKVFGDNYYYFLKSFSSWHT